MSATYYCPKTLVQAAAELGLDPDTAHKAYALAFVLLNTLKRFPWYQTELIYPEYGGYAALKHDVAVDILLLDRAEGIDRALRHWTKFLRPQYDSRRPQTISAEHGQVKALSIPESVALPTPPNNLPPSERQAFLDLAAGCTLKDAALNNGLNRHTLKRKLQRALTQST